MQAKLLPITNGNQNVLRTLILTIPFLFTNKVFILKVISMQLAYYRTVIKTKCEKINILRILIHFYFYLLYLIQKILVRQPKHSNPLEIVSKHKQYTYKFLYVGVCVCVYNCVNLNLFIFTDVRYVRAQAQTIYEYFCIRRAVSF